MSLLVAAIDFGTTYSGWAFSFKDEFERDPLKVFAKHWSGGQTVSLKGPTSALIKPNGRTLEAFGYEAETKYTKLAMDNCHRQHYYFRRFKMILHNKVRKNAIIDEPRHEKTYMMALRPVRIKISLHICAV